jgi:hypothetical protein
MRLHILFAVITSLLLAAVAVGDEADKSTKVTGVFVIPKEVATFAGHGVDIRLYEYDPFLADASATLVDQVEMNDFGHTQNKETRTEFVIGAEGQIKPRMSYYVTLFILKDGKRTHMGKVPGQFLCKVLTNDNPREIEMVVQKVGG